MVADSNRNLKKMFHIPYSIDKSCNFPPVRNRNIDKNRSNDKNYSLMYCEGKSIAFTQLTIK